MITNHSMQSWIGKIKSSPPRLGFLFLAIAILLIPTYVRLATTVWTNDDNAHGAIVFLILLWLAWDEKTAFLKAEIKESNLLGWPLLLIGLFFYTIGRSQSVVILEVSSHIFILLGLVFLFRGVKAAWTIWFPLVYMVFLIPMPGFFVDAITAPLKSQVSVIVESLLYNLGYPIARTGVLLNIGQYQLLVADACSGLHSMYSLSAMGVIYLYLMRRKAGWVHNAIMLLSILPIAFFANIIRVIILVLLTYHFGDETAQGFLHGFAGMLLFIIGLISMFALDAALGFFLNLLRVSREKN